MSKNVSNSHHYKSRAFERMEKLLRLVTLMQSGSPYSINELADTLSVTRRTVFRYLKVLQKVGLPLEYSEPHRAHRFSSLYSASHPQLTAKELAALMLAISTTRPLPSKELNVLVNLAIAKLTSRLTGAAREQIANIRRACATQRQ